MTVGPRASRVLRPTCPVATRTTKSDRATAGTPDLCVSESEELLFGGPMCYDYGWAKHELASSEVTSWPSPADCPASFAWPLGWPGEW